MYVVVQLKPSVREKPSQGDYGQVPANLQEALLPLGINLLPMHPGTNDPALASYFYVDTPDQPTAERVIAQLRQHNSVEAAFLKPPEGPP